MPRMPKWLWWTLLGLLLAGYACAMGLAAVV